MRFEEDKVGFAVGKKLGFVLAYVVSTSFLYLILMFTKKDVPIYYVAAITFSIVIIGTIIKRLIR